MLVLLGWGKSERDEEEEMKTKAKRKKRGREGGREDATWRCDAMRRGGVLIHLANRNVMSTAEDASTNGISN